MILDLVSEHILLILVAIAISSFGNIVGIGGGVFLVPILIYLEQMDIEHAIGTSTVALFISSVMATAINSMKRNIEFRAGLIFEIPAIIGVFLGAYLTTVVTFNVLKILFATYLIWTAIKILRQKQSKILLELVNKVNSFGPKIQTRISGQLSLPTLGVFGSLAGLMGGMFGIGGGVIKTPIMIKLFKFEPPVATSTSVFMIAITSFFSALAHFSLGHIQWAVGLPVYVGFLMGAILGSFLKDIISTKYVINALAIAMILAAISLILH